MTTDDQKLTERIRDEVAGIVIGSGYYATAIGIDEAGEVAAAVLPILRRAQAEAWEKGKRAGMRQADYEYGACTFYAGTNPYEEQTNG